MIVYRNLCCLVAAILVSSSMSHAQSNVRYRPKVGERHVEFALPSVDNQELIRLTDFRGKKLLLFHFASW